MYKDLSLKEKSELFKLMVSNGITDINEIEKIYNKYDDGGNKISVNNLPESEQYAVTTPDGQRKVFNNKVEAQQYITANTPKGYSLYDTTNYGSNIDKGQTAILDRNTEREIEKATEEEIRNNARKANIESNKEYAMEALNAMPIIGDGMDIYSIVKDTYNKNYGNAALTAGMMLVPFDKLLKPVGKGIKKLYNKARKKSNAELTDNFDINKNNKSYEELAEEYTDSWFDLGIKSSKDINAKNLQNITDDEWDKLYNKAIKNNDVEETQRLRDLHFKAKAFNSKTIDNYGLPIHNYHGGQKGINVFFNSKDNLNYKNTKHQGYSHPETRIGIYFSPDKEIAKNYKRTYGKKGEIYDTYLKMDNPYIQKYSTTLLNRVKNLLFRDKYFDPAVIRDYRLNKELKGFDGVSHGDFENVVWDNKNIKLADPITYDDNGNIIPLSKRDDFTNPDIRFNWLLPTIGVGAGLSLINNNEDNQYKYGGAINKYDGTSTKTQQMQTVEKPAFFEGDTWKPQYWFSPEYENATLKEAITQAYEDGNYGKDIIWNGRAYKAILNEEDANEYRKKKGIALGEPIVNTANIQTNEKQPREYVSNSYIPVTNGNKIYYWDSYSGKFFEDAKGKTPTSKDYNTLLKDYYDQNISPALKENRYEDLIKLYVQQFRNLQARRRVSAREQDIPNDYGKRTITLTTGRSGSSRLPYPTDLIDSLSNHLQEGQSIYQALALPYKETEFGNRVNFESDVMGNRGHVLATLNDERYELPDQTFYSGLSYPLRSYFRNNKVDGKVDGMTQENFVKHYLASSENDLLDLKNLFNNKELLKYVGETLKKDLTKSRFVSFMNTNTKDNPNIYEHALSLLASGKYNPGEPGYNKGINKIAKQLENDPELNNYIDKHKIKKVGEKKK